MPSVVLNTDVDGTGNGRSSPGHDVSGRSMPDNRASARASGAAWLSCPGTERNGLPKVTTVRTASGEDRAISRA
jgi:hypothetical protein